MNILKEDLIKALEAIRRQIEHDDRCYQAFKVILPNDYTSGYDTNFVLTGFFELLKTLTNDTSDWIGYFAWELEFGAKWKPGMVTFQDADVPLANYDDLWNILQSGI